MEIIGSIKEVEHLDAGLSQFVSSACPWIYDDWEPEQLGWIFILEEEDLSVARSLCVVPHCTTDNNPVTIDLETFDMWETDAVQDQQTGYWNVVGIIGQEYGFSIFVSDSLAQQLSGFRKNIKVKAAYNP